MDKKIRGITIQFGADASPLGKALKDVEKTSSGLNGELRKVNKLLKFDPGNTTLLAQKQQILSESIENTQKKLTGLKQAQSEVEKMFKSGDIGEKEYREFQRTLEETEQSLRSYTTQMNRMQEEQKKFQKGTKELNTFLEATGKGLDDFQDVLGTKLTNALKNGTANSDDLTIAINKIGKAALGADTDLGKMRDALNQIDDGGIDEVRESLKKLESKSDDTEEALNNIGEGISAGNLLEAGEQVSGLGDKITDLGKKAVETFQNFEDATIKVNSRFDETGGSAQKNADLIKRVYETGIGDSLDSVANAVIIVKDNLKDLDDTSLENIVSQALILEDVYGIDMAESMRGVNALMKHFGTDATTAMDLLVSGTQNGLDKTNELGDNLSEYSGKFAEAGYSAEEYFQLLQNGLDNGAYNLDKVNDAINEVTTRLADGTIGNAIDIYSEKTQDLFLKWKNGQATQKEVIDSIVSDIAGCQNQQEQLNMAATAFGTMAEDGSMKFITSLTPVGDTYSDVGGKASEFQDKTTTSAQETESAMRKLSDTSEQFGSDIQEMLTPVLEFLAELAEMFVELPEPVRNFIEIIGGITAVVAVITPIISAVMILNGALTSLVGVGLLPIIGIIAGVVAVITIVITAIKNWGAITDWLSEKWQAFKDWISGIWEGIAETIQNVWTGITDWLSEKWQAFKDWISGIWEGIAETIQNVWTGIKDFFQTIWDAIYSVIEVPLNLIKSIIEGVMYAIYAAIYTVWEVIKFALKAAWDWISSTASAVFTPIAEFFSGVWNTISEVAVTIWETIKEALSTAWNWIGQTASAVFTPIAEFFSGVWNGIKDVAVNIWNTIKDTLDGIWGGIKDKATEVFSSLWKFIKEGFNSLKDTLGGIVSGIAKGIITPIGNAINGVIKGVNWILDKVGSKKQFDLWEIPKFARGAAGLPEDTIGIVNDQKGSVYKELIVPPDGKPFIPEGRDVVLPMKKGTKILPADETKNLFSVLPHFASGIGDFFSGLWESVSSFTGNVLDYIQHPKKIVQIAIDKFTDLSGIVEPWLSVTTGAVNSVVDNITDFVKEIFDKELTVKYNASAGVEQWRGLAEKALRMTGQYSEANLQRLLYQMQTESGGNPNAINNWDSNAAAGIPSKGLMQVIDPTFRAYAMQGYNTNIYDPLSNMLASIRYAVATYGSLERAYRGVGYEEGIGSIDLSKLFSVPSLDIRYFKEGGILTKPRVFSTGHGIGVAGEGTQNEAIAPVQKLKEYIQDSILEILGSKNIEISIDMIGYMDGRAVAKGQAHYIQPMIEKKEKMQRWLRGDEKWGY